MSDHSGPLRSGLLLLLLLLFATSLTHCLVYHESGQQEQPKPTSPGVDFAAVGRYRNSREYRLRVIADQLLRTGHMSPQMVALFKTVQDERDMEFRERRLRLEAGKEVLRSSGAPDAIARYSKYTQVYQPVPLPHLPDPEELPQSQIQRIRDYLDEYATDLWPRSSHNWRSRNRNRYLQIDELRDPNVPTTTATPTTTTTTTVRSMLVSQESRWVPGKAGELRPEPEEFGLIGWLVWILKMLMLVAFGAVVVFGVGWWSMNRCMRRTQFDEVVFRRHGCWKRLVNYLRSFRYPELPPMPPAQDRY